MTRILICTIGATPQVVTETVWALGATRQWIPDEIEVITTAFKPDVIHRVLMSEDGPLARLMGRAPPVKMLIPRSDCEVDETEVGAGAPKVSSRALRDVNTMGEATLMGELITQRIARAVLEEEADLHVSVAGGRKTMSAHAVMALSAVGRPGHKASHVLVNAEFEDHPDFFFPSQGGPLLNRKSELWTTPRPEPTLDPATARVTLVETPVILARYPIRNYAALLERGFSDMMDQINVASTFALEPALTVDTTCNTITLNGRSLRLSPKLFAIFRLMAAARAEGWGVNLDDGLAGGLTPKVIAEGLDSTAQRVGDRFGMILADAVSVAGGDSDNAKSVLGTSAALRSRYAASTLGTQLGPNRVHLRDALIEAFGQPLVDQLFSNTKNRPFGLRIPRQAITIL